MPNAPIKVINTLELSNYNIGTLKFLPKKSPRKGVLPRRILHSDRGVALSRVLGFFSTKARIFKPPPFPNACSERTRDTLNGMLANPRIAK